MTGGAPGSLPFYVEEPDVDGQVVHPLFTVHSDLRHQRGIGNLGISLMEPGPQGRESLADDPLAAAVRALSRDAAGVPTPGHLQVQLMTEQVPNARSRVQLAADRDALGVPRAQLHWELDALDRHTLRVGAELAADQLAAVGFGRLRSAVHGGPRPFSVTGGHHHMGATRMHDDPARGVVDANGRVHGTDNLYVASSATFPTGGFANPTLTVVAMALRLAGHPRAGGEA